MSSSDGASAFAPYKDVLSERRRQAFVDGRIPVAVYGLGKMGLPLAAVYAETTGNVVGVDVDPERVDQVRAGACPFDHEPGLAPLLADLHEAGSLDATTDGSAAATTANLHVVIVPTVLTDERTPDLSNLESAVDDVAAGLTPGDLVVVESTVPPGTCRDVVAPALADASGLSPDEFGVAFCPERTASGRALADIRGTYPKVVGGVDSLAGAVAADVYDELVDNEVVRVGDATTAECVKLFEGVYRDVNIALANELAGFVDEFGVDVREAIAAANTQPFCDIHDPGAGVGGHCIPYYPYFLAAEAGTPTRLVQTARDVNEAMPESVVEKTAEELAAAGVDVDDATVVLLGVAYRAGVPETRESPALDIAAGLTDRGADVLAVDPVVQDWPDVAADRLAMDQLASVDADAVVLVTGHEAFEDVDWNALGTGCGADSMGARPVVIDGRDVLGDDAPDGTYVVGRGAK